MVGGVFLDLWHHHNRFDFDGDISPFTPHNRVDSDRPLVELDRWAVGCPDCVGGGDPCAKAWGGALHCLRRGGATTLFPDS